MIRTLIFFLQWSCIKINCQIQILHINYFLKWIRVNVLSYNNDIISLIKYLMDILMDKKNQLFLCRKMYVRSCIWFNVISRANVFSYKYIQFIVGFDIPLIFRRFHIYSSSVGLQLNTRYLKSFKMVHPLWSRVGTSLFVKEKYWIWCFKKPHPENPQTKTKIL